MTTTTIEETINIEEMIDRPGTYFVRITPETAKRLLERNTGNRKPKAFAILLYANDMRRGRWRRTNQGIGLDTNGVLLDGQNRLMACIEANVPFDTVVVTGLEPDARDVVDLGVKRTLADVLKMAGKVNVMQLSGGATLRVRYEHLIKTGRPYTQNNPTEIRLRLNHEDMLAYVNAHPSLEKTINTLHVLRTAFPVLPASAIIAFDSMAMEVDHAALTEFRESVATGANLNLGDPRLVLRNFLSRTYATRRGGPSSMYFLGVMIKAWNDWRHGRSREILTMKDTETMPILDGLPVKRTRRQI